MSIIYNMIPKDRFITREELARKTGISDRMIRREINELRKNPETIIISSSSQKGYKRPATKDEILMCLNESKSRVRDEIEKQIVLSRALSCFREDDETVQPSLF